MARKKLSGIMLNAPSIQTVNRFHLPGFLLMVTLCLMGSLNGMEMGVSNKIRDKILLPKSNVHIFKLVVNFLSPTDQFKFGLTSKDTLIWKCIEKCQELFEAHKYLHTFVPISNDFIMRPTLPNDITSIITVNYVMQTFPLLMNALEDPFIFENQYCGMQLSKLNSGSMKSIFKNDDFQFNLLISTDGFYYNYYCGGDDGYDKSVEFQYGFNASNFYYFQSDALYTWNIPENLNHSSEMKINRLDPSDGKPKLYVSRIEDVAICNWGILVLEQVVWKNDEDDPYSFGYDLRFQKHGSDHDTWVLIPQKIWEYFLNVFVCGKIILLENGFKIYDQGNEKNYYLIVKHDRQMKENADTIVVQAGRDAYDENEFDTYQLHYNTSTEGWPWREHYD